MRLSNNGGRERELKCSFYTDCLRRILCCTSNLELGTGLADLRRYTGRRLLHPEEVHVTHGECTSLFAVPRARSPQELFRNSEKAESASKAMQDLVEKVARNCFSLETKGRFSTLYV